MKKLILILFFLLGCGTEPIQRNLPALQKCVPTNEKPCPKPRQPPTHDPKDTEELKN